MTETVPNCHPETEAPSETKQEKFERDELNRLAKNMTLSAT